MKKIRVALLFVTLLISWSLPSTLFASDEEALGNADVQANKLRSGFQHFLKAVKTASERSEKDRRLREKILALFSKITPKPAIPEEAEKYMARGRAGVKSAKDQTGFIRASWEYKKAINAAPWFADAYYNLGVVYDKAGDYPAAIYYLKLFIAGATTEQDKKEAKSLLYEIEFRIEEKGRIAKEKQKAEAEKRNRINVLAGTWTRKGWSHAYEQPTFNGTWYKEGTSHVTINGNSFSTTVKTSGWTYAYSGTINETKINGNATVSGQHLFCQKKHGHYTYPFEGTINYQTKQIMLVYRGGIIEGSNVCRFNPKFVRGYLLVR